MSGPIEIKATIAGAESVTRRLLNVTPEAQKRVRDEVKRQGLEVLRLAKEKVSGDVLNVRTGRLRRSLNEKGTDDGSTFTSTTGTNVVYARIHELGGIIKRKERTQILKFRTTKGGAYMHQSDLAMGPHRSAFAYKALVFAKAKATKNFTERKQKIKGHDIVMPQRSFLASSLADRKNEIRAGILKAMGGLGK